MRQAEDTPCLIASDAIIKAAGSHHSPIKGREVRRDGHVPKRSPKRGSNYSRCSPCSSPVRSRAFVARPSSCRSSAASVNTTSLDGASISRRCPLNSRTPDGTRHRHPPRRPRRPRKSPALRRQAGLQTSCRARGDGDLSLPIPLTLNSSSAEVAALPTRIALELSPKARPCSSLLSPPSDSRKHLRPPMPAPSASFLPPVELLLHPQALGSLEGTSTRRCR